MPTIEVNGKSYETDEEGYLVNLAEWNEDVAKHIAQTEGTTILDHSLRNDGDDLRDVAQRLSLLRRLQTLRIDIKRQYLSGMYCKFFDHKSFLHM